MHCFLYVSCVLLFLGCFLVFWCLCLWFTLCLAISLSSAGKPKEDSEPTSCGSPILVMTLVFGLLAQLHPSASGALGTVVDSIPEIASTSCVLSAGRISIDLLCF